MAPIRNFQIKLRPELEEEFLGVQQEEGYSTRSQLLEALLETYKNPPTKVVDNPELIERTSVLAQKVKELTEKNDLLEGIKSDLENEIAQRDAQIEDLANSKIELQDEKERLTQASKLPDNCLLVEMGELERRCLLYSAKRESLQRKKDVPASAFLLFLLMENLMKGRQYSFSAIPDRVISQYKKDIEAGKEYVYYE